MRRLRFAAVAAFHVSLVAGAAGFAATSALVVCAPGYPGSTAEAQPAMDAFAAALGAAAGLSPTAVQAVYFETEAAGLARLGEPDTALALVPLPFYLQHREALHLTPRAQAVMQGGKANEAWTLVAATGSVASAADLAGRQIVSLAGYVPRFVRGPALAGFGAVPAGAEIAFSGAVLSALRRAAAGEPVTVLLDGPQAAALTSLPFASKLTAVYVSPPLPVSVLCTVASRLSEDRGDRLVRAALSLRGSETGGAALDGLRLVGFVALDEAALRRAGEAFNRADAPP